MIYCVNRDFYPKEKVIEEISYNDQNEMEWRIARTERGLFLKYFGYKCFLDKLIVVVLSINDFVKIKNTGCYFIQENTFNTFCEIRNVLKSGYTDDIHECIEELFRERLIKDNSLIVGEHA